MFMASAAMGSAFAMIINHFIPSAHLSPGAFALVAMGAVFGAASRATFAFIIFAFELTRDYNSVLPLMLVCVIADGVAMMFMKTSIMTEKLARRGLHINQDYEADVLMELNVEDVMEPDAPRIPATMLVRELGDLIATRDPKYVRYHGFVVTDAEGKLAGLITQGDVLRALEGQGGGDMPVLDAGARNVVVTYPNELLYDAAGKMLRAGVGRMPVVSRDDSKKVVGYLNRAGILSARLKRMHEEGHREPGWLHGWRGKKVAG
jgi:CBS domain-containing protein